ncbi:MAG: hypothetical protein OXQ90_17120 [Gammaproteobacteria bacterium]|nr:hypothetical protein [Gammaproteobacteria bacterium]
MLEELSERLAKAHEGLFEHFQVDCCSGVVRGPYLKFTSYPYVGSRYGTGKKLMVVGLDIGDNEGGDRIQSYECRRRRVEPQCPTSYGPHMAGTYVTAMYVLVRELNEECDEWKRWLDEACRDGKDSTPQELLRTKRLPDRNPVSHIAFTNYYKFLVANTGEKLQLERGREECFLVEEAQSLEPDAILLQSAAFRSGYEKLLSNLSTFAMVFVGNHPAVRGEARRLENFLKSIEPFPWKRT